MPREADNSVPNELGEDATPPGPALCPMLSCSGTEVIVPLPDTLDPVRVLDDAVTVVPVRDGVDCG